MTKEIINSNSQQSVPKFNAISKQLYKLRNVFGFSLKNPKTIDEIELTRAEFNLTTNSLRHLLVDKKSPNTNQRMICYASDQQLQILSSCVRWHCDGTFRSASLFYQLYVIYGFMNVEMFPCAYFYTEKKSERWYTQMLKDLCEHSKKKGFSLAPKLKYYF